MTKRTPPPDTRGFGLLARHGSNARVAVGDAGPKTARELVADSAAVVRQLDRADASRRILLLTRDRYHFAVGLIAAWKRGGTVILPPNTQTDTLHDILRDGRCTSLHDGECEVGLDLRRSLGQASSGEFDLEFAADRELVQLWTSGSSGTSSTHAKSARQLLGETEVLRAEFDVDADTRVLATVPSHHIYGLLFGILLPLSCGGVFVRETPLHPLAVAALLRTSGASVLVSVPAHLRALSSLGRGELPSLGRVFSSGAPLLTSTADALRRHHGIDVTEVFGSTETGGIAWRIHEDSDSRWSPLPSVRVDVDADARLVVTSPFLAGAEPGPMTTGDRVELLDDGSFRHLGRTDGVVKVAGKRVALMDLERRLCELEGVSDAAVRAREIGGARDHELVALVVAPGRSPDMLREDLRRWFDPVVVPRRIQFVDQIPREPNGKVSAARFAETLGQSRTPPRFLQASLQERSQEAGRDRASFEVTVPRHLYPLRGHFSHFPLVPGVVILDLAHRTSCALWSDLACLRRVLRLKFKRPFRPGERADLELSRRDGETRVGFGLSVGEHILSSGTLEFGPPAD